MLDDGRAIRGNATLADWQQLDQTYPRQYDGAYSFIVHDTCKAIERSGEARGCNTPVLWGACVGKTTIHPPSLEKPDLSGLPACLWMWEVSLIALEDEGVVWGNVAVADWR